MPEGLFSSIVQILIAIVASGVAVKLLTLRQDRRKIAGDASAQEANAASTLSGAALQMVTAAQNSTKDAEARATKADDRAEAADSRTDEARLENQRLWQELNKARWELHWRETNEEVLKAALRERGVEIETPPRPQGFPDFPPPAQLQGPA